MAAWVPIEPISACMSPEPKNVLSQQAMKGSGFNSEGGAPGWQQLIPAEPTLETEVIISRDGDRILSVPYNGPLRHPRQP